MPTAAGLTKAHDLLGGEAQEADGRETNKSKKKTERKATHVSLVLEDDDGVRGVEGRKQVVHKDANVRRKNNKRRWCDLCMNMWKSFFRIAFVTFPLAELMENG